MIMNDPPERDRSYHRVILTGLLANGEKLLHELGRRQEVNTKNVGIELHDFEAAVAEFRLSYADGLAK